MVLLEQLCEVVLSRSLSALQHWDGEGFEIPTVSVNFPSQELSNPKLIDRLKWELDRFNLAQNRLNIEILEDVTAVSKDDVIVRNIQAMAEFSCSVDLDDFGTGHASIANIRRFSVNRIKIDRSFITRVDQDRDQQNMVSTILTMAELLEIDTVAEGVETIGEHTKFWRNWLADMFKVSALQSQCRLPRQTLGSRNILVDCQILEKLAERSVEATPACLKPLDLFALGLLNNLTQKSTGSGSLWTIRIRILSLQQS